MPEKITSFRGPHYFLSNFYPCRIVFEGVEYKSLEHAFQAAKTLDLGERETIRQAGPAGNAKRLGRKVTLRADWNEIRVDVMRELIRQKFAATGDLRVPLLATNDAILEEANNWGDRFWGTVDGVGENHLGKLLMEQRERLR